MRACHGLWTAVHISMQAVGLTLSIAGPCNSSLRVSVRLGALLAATRTVLRIAGLLKAAVHGRACLCRSCISTGSHKDLNIIPVFSSVSSV